MLSRIRRTHNIYELAIVPAFTVFHSNCTLDGRFGHVFMKSLLLGMTAKTTVGS